MEEKKQKKTQCDLCKKLFTNVTTHKKSVHEKIKDFKCSRCTAAYTRKDIRGQA